jgi:hypothetical protein
MRDDLWEKVWLVFFCAAMGFAGAQAYHWYQLKYCVSWTSYVIF